MSVEFTGQGVVDITVPASADLSASQYCFVVINSSGQAALPGSTGANAHGILQNQPNAAGRAAVVRLLGGSKLVAAGAVTVGADLATNSTTGRGLAAATTNRRLAQAVTGCSNAGEIISVIMMRDGNMP